MKTNHQLIYRICKRRPDLQVKMDYAKGKIVQTARMNVIKAVKTEAKNISKSNPKEKDLALPNTWKFLEARDPDFTPKTKNANVNVNLNATIEEIKKKNIEKIKGYDL